MGGRRALEKFSYSGNIALRCNMESASIHAFVLNAPSCDDSFRNREELYKAPLDASTSCYLISPQLNIAKKHLFDPVPGIDIDSGTHKSRGQHGHLILGSFFSGHNALVHND